MNNRVLKHRLTEGICVSQRVHLPEGAQVLHFEYNWDGFCFWFLGDTGRKIETRFFIILGTGNTAVLGTRYVGTTMIPSEQTVWHLFEILP